MFVFIDAVRTIGGDPWPAIERFVAEPPNFLPAPAHPLGGGRWRVAVGFGSVRHEVLMEVDRTWTLPDGWIRAFRWSPVRSSGRTDHPFLPDLAGRLALRQDDRLRLEVVAHYSPPFGVVGARLDTWQLRQVARRTLEQLGEEVGRSLTGHVAAAATRTGSRTA